VAANCRANSACCAAQEHGLAHQPGLGRRGWGHLGPPKCPRSSRVRPSWTSKVP